VPFAAGSATDQIARALGQAISAETEQSVVIDNKAGASGFIASSQVAKAAPDGYTVLITTNTTHAANEHLYKKLPYDPTRDLVAVAHVPYKVSNPAMMDVLAGNVDLMVSSLPSAMGQIRSGKLRALAVTSARRSSALPEVPTVAELGYKDFDVSTWYGLFVPAGRPAAVVATVHEAVNQLLARPEVVEAIHAQGAEPQAMTAAQFSDLVGTDHQKWRGIVRASGATLE